MKPLMLIVGAIAALCASFWAGMEVEDLNNEMAFAALSSRCYSTTRLEAFVSRDGVDFVCFKQNIDTKKISKTMIVNDEQ